jgi:A/G-specific adenine glycosylase
LKRVFAPRLDSKSTAGQRRLWEIAESILPRSGATTWTHNQALMELGALVCTARVAHCHRCPVQSLCKSAKLMQRVSPVGCRPDRPSDNEDLCIKYEFSR